MTYSDEESQVPAAAWAKTAIGNSRLSSSLATCPRGPRRDDFADEIAAFANADGGVLLCGVTDDGEVPGHVAGADRPLWTPAWSRPAPTPLSRLFASAPITGS